MKNINKIISFAFICFLLAGCKKDVDLKPTDSILEEDAFLTIDHLQAGLNTAYARFNGENSSFINAVLTDEARYGRDNAGQGQFTYRWQYGQDVTTGGDVTPGWGNFYSMIQAANIVLDNMSKVPALNTADSTRKNSIAAQAMALRAFGHWELHLRFSKGVYNAADLSVPYITTFVDPTTAPKPARDSSSVVVNRIQQELRTASSMMPATTAANFTDVVLNKLNITALQARIALYKREWQRASDSATAVINSAIRPLVPAATFAQIWTDANLTSEVLFRIKRNSASNGAQYVTTTNFVYFSPSIKLRNSYAPSDTRQAAYFAFFAPNTVPGNWVVFKFYQSALGGRVNDYKVIRTSEMYLIRAEAAIELANEGNAGTADLTELRNIRTAGAVPVFATKDDGIKFVLDERFRELCFEGFRFFDLKRRGLGIERNLLDVESTNWLNLEAGNFRFALPIPTAEIQANPNIVQNPNY